MKKFTLLKNPTTWRRLSIGTWRAPNDPTVYGRLEIDFGPAQKFLEDTNKNSQVKITPTHLVSKAIALTLKKYPDLNGIIRWKKIYLRKTVDVFLQVAIEDAQGADLSGVKIESCETKSLTEIALALRTKCQKARAREDPHFRSTFNLMKFVPQAFLGFVLQFMSFLNTNLGFSFPKLGLPEDPFGSVMVTSVGMFRMPSGFAPLVPISRVPLIVCVGEVRDKPWVEEGKILIKPILDISVTFDHRFMDGLTGARMAHYFREILESPGKFMA